MKKAIPFVMVASMFLASCDTLMPPGVMGADGRISPCNGHHTNPQDCGYATFNAPLLRTLELGQTKEQVRATMKHDGERKEARMENGTAIETWTYMANYENERMSQITFTDGKVTEIKDVPWGDED